MCLEWNDHLFEDTNRTISVAINLSTIFLLVEKKMVWDAICLRNGECGQWSTVGKARYFQEEFTNTCFANILYNLELIHRKQDQCGDVSCAPKYKPYQLTILMNRRRNEIQLDICKNKNWRMPIITKHFYYSLDCNNTQLHFRAADFSMNHQRVQLQFHLWISGIVWMNVSLCDEPSNRETLYYYHIHIMIC